jgi:tetratricopeptide (TPR) repeat protein
VITAPRRFILLVVGIVVAAAAIMAPRRDEWLAMMRDEDKQAQIIALLEPRVANGDNDPELLATLGRSYGEIGSYRRAIDLLERYLALRPNDGDAYGRLADFYGHTGDTARQIAMLERSIAISRKLPRAVELANLYHERRQAGQELGLLARFEAEATLENGLLLRLAQLYANLGDRTSAIRVLSRPEVLSVWSPPIRNGEARLLVAELLVQSGRSGEVARLGKDWILQWREPWLDNRLLNVVALPAPIEASELAEATAVLHPEVRFFLAHGLFETGAKPVARHLLETWVGDTPSPSMIDIAAFLSACRDQDAQDVVWYGFEEVLRVGSSNELIADFSEAIASEFGIGALAPFWRRLLEAVTERRPLLAARLAFHEHDLPLAKLLLSRVELLSLDPSNRQMWLNLLVATTPPPETLRILRERRLNGQLTPDLLVQYAQLAGGVGNEIEFRAALADLRRNPN